MQDIVKLRIFRDFYNFWIELEDLSNRKELITIKEKYHKSYLEICWKCQQGFGIFSIISLILFILIFQDKSKDRTVVVFPLMALIIWLIIDQIIEYNKNLIEIVIFFFFLINGIIFTHEGLQYNEYRFHEDWLIFYTVYLVTSIATCFHWK